ncbi:hypothetical protein J7L13_00490 [bacterium]|nr:hypothetical protein [bacterium]
MRIKVVKARKTHICAICNKPIQKGEEYALSSSGKYHIDCWNRVNPRIKVLKDNPYPERADEGFTKVLL